MNVQSPLMSSASDTSRLFNSAFCAVLLNKACAAYGERDGAAMPITFAFLILPSALHKPTREALPGTTGAAMWGWLRDNPVLLMDFVERVRTFRPFTGAAIAYGLSSAAIVGSPGAISAGGLKRRPRTLFPTDDWNSCVKAAEFLGRWFSSTNIDESTTLAHWGVKP